MVLCLLGAEKQCHPLVLSVFRQLVRLSHSQSSAGGHNLIGGLQSGGEDYSMALERLFVPSLQQISARQNCRAVVSRQYPVTKQRIQHSDDIVAESWSSMISEAYLAPTVQRNPQHNREQLQPVRKLISVFEPKQ